MWPPRSAAHALLVPRSKTSATRLHRLISRPIASQKSESIRVPDSIDSRKPPRSVVERGPSRSGVVYRADWVLVDSGRALRNGWVRVVDGRIADLGRGTRGEYVGTLLAPGCVNAHAHLDLTTLDSLPRETDFARWVSSLVAAKRGRTAHDDTVAFDAGVAELLATGTTTVGDIDSTGQAARLRGAPLRGIAFREWIGPTPERAREALGPLREPLSGTHRFACGLSPHAPYSVSAEVLRSTPSPHMPVQMHLAETSDEERWLRDGSGPIGEMLARFGVPRSARSSWDPGVLEVLDASGWLLPNVSIAHGNFLGQADLERLAGRGVGLVHCPGTHAYFDRARDPIHLARETGVTWALGTDGKVTGGSLDLRFQARLGQRAHPRIPAHDWFAAATFGGARVLGLARVGRLLRGHAADLVAFRGVCPKRACDAFSAWLDRDTVVDRVWIAGVPVENGLH